MFPTAHNLADPFRRLLEAVKEALRADGRRGWLAGPLALLMWISTRRMRKEIEAAAKQFVAMLEQLVVLLDDFRAGRLTAPAPAPPDAAWERATAKPHAFVPPSRRTAPEQRRERTHGAAGSAAAPALRSPSPRLPMRPPYPPPQAAISARAGITPRSLAPGRVRRLIGPLQPATRCDGVERRQPACAYVVTIR
jgi:hypothetical protein